MKETIKRALKRGLQANGRRLVYSSTQLYGEPVPNELEASFLDLYGRCASYTMTSLERMYAAYSAARYVARVRLPGAIVECGVWKGGSTMIMLNALLELGIRDREVYLYDTFEGMSEPTTRDKGIRGQDARKLWEERRSGENSSSWCYSSVDDTRRNIESTGYPMENVHFVKGKVEETIPMTSPGCISILRLDTDWYESTYHELKHLYPQLAVGGVLIIDDYGHWSGAREATDQYFAETQTPMLLGRIDYTGRMGIKTGVGTAKAGGCELGRG